jgi:hypothetical protein
MQTEETTITEEKVEVTPLVDSGVAGNAMSAGATGADVVSDNVLNGEATTASGVSGDDSATTTQISAEAYVTPLAINSDKLKDESKSTEPVFAHIALMAKHGIEAKSLPNNIKNDLKVWAMTRPRAEGDKSGKIIISLKKRSVVIADAIQDWIEKDYPEKSEEEVQAHINAKDEAEAKAKAESDRLEAEAKAESDRLKAKAKAESDKLKAEANREREEQVRRSEARNRMRRTPPVKELTLEEKQVQMILNGLDANEKIHYDVLKNILGRNIGLSDIKVGDTMILRNQYMTNYYYIHKK